MERWTASRITSVWDVSVTAFLLAAAIVEIVTTSPVSPAARVGYAVGTISWLVLRRTIPLLAVGGVSVGLVAQSLLLESTEDVGILLAVVVAAYSLAAHSSSRRRRAGCRH